MPPRKTVQPQKVSFLSAEKAYPAFNRQFESLFNLIGRHYAYSRQDLQEWENLTESLIERTFGNPSSNLTKFRNARRAGTNQANPYGGGPSEAQLQTNYGLRLQSHEALVRSILSELRLDLPESEIKGVYAPGEEYEFYSDVKNILKLGTRDVLIVDPYLNTEIFDVYASALPRSVKFRLLSNNLLPDVLRLAQKYASGGNFELRSTNKIHDRVIFADDRVFVIGQSLKDAAKAKPTYIVEHDSDVMKAVYDDVWGKATVII